MRALIDFPGKRERCARRFENPRDVLTAWQAAEVPGVIARAWASARAGNWVVGHVAYEAAPAFDPAMRVHAPQPSLPLARFGVYARAAPMPAGMGAEAIPATPEVDAPAYVLGDDWSSALDAPQAMAHIGAIRRAIERGDVYQVNLTTRLRTAFAGDALAFFRLLQRAQPGGYGLFLDAGPWQVLSVSPELFFDWTEEGELTAQPMKGTASRHDDPERDVAQMRDMQQSAKERAENLMIVDLLRNDLSRVAQLGSVHVPVLFEAQALPTVWQMTSTVRCHTRKDVGLDGIFGALFPCGSVTGAPKVAAMNMIHALEADARGVYCGALGVIRPGGHATFSVAIRTVTIDRAAGRAECGVGSGITWDSQAAGEWAEWQVKRLFLERAAALAAR